MKLSLEELVNAVVFGSFFLIILMSLISRLLHFRAERRLAHVRHVCRLCGHVFAESEIARLSHCPSCDALNLHRGNGKLG